MNSHVNFERYLLTIIFILIFSFKGFSQTSLLPNEKTVFSFTTNTGKNVILACDTADIYLVFRIIANDKTEFEYPGKTKNSWKNFEYSYYMRGGGAENEGLDLNYLYFIYKDLQYVIYETFSASENKTEAGLKIIDLKAETTQDFKGKKGSVTGTLIEFRNNELVKKGETLFN